MPFVLLHVIQGGWWSSIYLVVLSVVTYIHSFGNLGVPYYKIHYFMNKLLKIFCLYGLFCLCYCCKNSINPNLINKKVCKQILVKNYFDDNEYIINDDISIQELYELLQNTTLCDIIKLPPRLVLTIKGTNYHQTFFICDNYIKDDKRKIYRCKKNIEKELKKIIKE